MTINFSDLSNGKLVNLVEISDSFIDDMWEYSKDERLYEYFEFNRHKSKNETKTYLEKLLLRNSLPKSHYYFIQEKISNKVIGSIGVDDIDVIKMSCEISYAVSPSYWGKGIFYDALKTLLEDLFVQKKFNRVQATTFATNMRSIMALKKFGFESEGILRDFYRRSDKTYADAEILGLLKKDFIQSNNI